MKREVALQIPITERLLLREAVRREHNRVLKRKLLKDERPSSKAMEIATLKSLYDTLAILPEENVL